jgi:hypothetical protein
MGLIARGARSSQHVAKFVELQQFLLDESKFCDCRGAIFGACTFVPTVRRIGW